MNVYFTDTYLRWAREAMMKYSEIHVLGWRLVKVCSVSLLQALQIFRQSKTGLKNNEENCLFHVRCHSLSGRAHCCRRVPGTWNEVGWKGVWREDQCGHTNLHPRAVTLACCSEPSAFAAKIFKSPEHVFWRGMRYAGCFTLVKTRYRGDWIASYSYLKGSYKDVNVKL